MGDSCRECGFINLLRSPCTCDSRGGDGITDGKPMDGVESAVGEFSDPIRCLVFNMRDGGDFSLNLSSSVRVRGRE